MEDIYIVLMINLIVWTGIFGYQMKISKEIDKLKKDLLEKQK
jgi:hypothetical protein